MSELLGALAKLEPAEKIEARTLNPIQFILPVRTDANGFISVAIDLLIPPLAGDYGWSIAAYESWGSAAPGGQGDILFAPVHFSYFPISSQGPTGQLWRVWIAVQAYRKWLVEGVHSVYNEAGKRAAVTITLPER